MPAIATTPLGSAKSVLTCLSFPLLELRHPIAMAPPVHWRQQLLSVQAHLNLNLQHLLQNHQLTHEVFLAVRSRRLLWDQNHGSPTSLTTLLAPFSSAKHQLILQSHINVTFEVVQKNNAKPNRYGKQNYLLTWANSIPPPPRRRKVLRLYKYNSFQTAILTLFTPYIILLGFPAYFHLSFAKARLLVTLSRTSWYVWTISQKLQSSRKAPPSTLNSKQSVPKKGAKFEGSPRSQKSRMSILLKMKSCWA